jgi:acetyl-CoA acetyltransferase
MRRQFAILRGNRIPFARSNGPYAEASHQDMLTTALDGLVARFALQGERAGEVVAGAVLKHSRGFNLTRECVLGSALDHATPADDVQQACGTGLQAALAVGAKIALGQIDWGIAGGVDTTSDAPIAVNEDLRRLLLEASRTKSVAGRLKLLDHVHEIHEAFDAHVRCTLKAWEERSLGPIDRSKLNVAGGSLAAGHPFAATGGRLLATVAKLLAERGSGRALASICAPGGQGVVAIVERSA